MPLITGPLLERDSLDRQSEERSETDFDLTKEEGMGWTDFEVVFDYRSQRSRPSEILSCCLTVDSRWSKELISVGKYSVSGSDRGCLSSKNQKRWKAGVGRDRYLAVFDCSDERKKTKNDVLIRD